MNNPENSSVEGPPLRGPRTTRRSSLQTGIKQADWSRRQFLKTSLAAGAALSLPRSAMSAPAAAPAAPAVPGIVDTNVSLFQWPFRKLKYSDTAALVAKLKKHR